MPATRISVYIAGDLRASSIVAPSFSAAATAAAASSALRSSASSPVWEAPKGRTFMTEVKNLHALQRAKWFERFFCHVSSSLHVDTEGKAKTMPEAGRAAENASPYAQKPSKHARRKRASSYAARVSPNRRTMLGGLGPYRFGSLRERLRQAFASEQNRASAAPARLSFEGRMTNRRNPAPLTFTLASGKTGHRHQARHNCSKRRKPPDRSIIR